MSSTSPTCLHPVCSGGAHSNKVTGLGIRSSATSSSGELVSVGWDDCVRFGDTSTHAYSGDSRSTSGQPVALGNKSYTNQTTPHHNLYNIPYSRRTYHRRKPINTSFFYSTLVFPLPLFSPQPCPQRQPWEQ